MTRSSLVHRLKNSPVKATTDDIIVEIGIKTIILVHFTHKVKFCQKIIICSRKPIKFNFKIQLLIIFGGLLQDKL